MAVGYVEVTNTSILKPHAPSPVDEHQLITSLSFTTTKHPVPCNAAEVPLTIFDQVANDMHVVVLCVFRPPMPDNSAMKEGLARALSYFPHLSGRLVYDEGMRRRPHILLNGAGILLVESAVSSTVDENLPLKLSSELMSCLYPSRDGAEEELLLVQINRFACGGLVLGMSTNHKIADGHSMNLFLTTWAKLVRGLDLDCFPCHERSAISVPRSPLRCDFDHYKNEISRSPSSPLTTSSPVELVTLHFSPDFISKLKAKVVGGAGSTGRRCTTFRCLLTHMWKKITQVRGLRDEEVTRVRVAVNGRARLTRPSIPMEYFGNLVMWAYPWMTVKEVLEESYGSVADKIENAVAEIDDAYFRSFIDFGEMLKRGGGEGDLLINGMPAEESLFPDLEVDSWLSFSFHEVDFGTGPLCAFLPSFTFGEGLLIFIPACEKYRWVDVFVGVFHEQAEILRQISHDLG